MQSFLSLLLPWSLHRHAALLLLPKLLPSHCLWLIVLLKKDLMLQVGCGHGYRHCIRTIL